MTMFTYKPVSNHFYSGRGGGGKSPLVEVKSKEEISVVPIKAKNSASAVVLKEWLYSSMREP
jgi:hypothetical protein